MYHVVVSDDPMVDPEVYRTAPDGVERVGRAELFERADHVSVHAPDTPETRGPADEDAIVAALSAGTVGAAGLDVFEREPLPDDSPLRDRDDVVLSSLAAWYSGEAHDE